MKKQRDGSIVYSYPKVSLPLEYTTLSIEIGHISIDVLPTISEETRFRPIEITDSRFEETYTAYVTRTSTGWSGRIPDIPEVNKCEETTKQALLTTLKDNLYEALKARSDAWDKQIEEDVKAGRLDHLREEILEDIESGRLTDL